MKTEIIRLRAARHLPGLMPVDHRAPGLQEWVQVIRPEKAGVTVAVDYTRRVVSLTREGRVWEIPLEAAILEQVPDPAAPVAPVAVVAPPAPVERKGKAR